MVTTPSRWECPQCGRRAEALVPPTAIPVCVGPAEKHHIKPVLMQPTKAAPRKKRAPIKRKGFAQSKTPEVPCPA